MPLHMTLSSLRLLLKMNVIYSFPLHLTSLAEHHVFSARIQTLFQGFSPRILTLFVSLLTPSLWRWKEDLRTSKTTDNLANLCIRCRPPIASAILFGSFLLVFSDSSQTSKIRHGISPCFHVFRGAKTDFSFQQKKIPKKNSPPGGFTHFSFFLIIRLKLLSWNVKERKVGFWMTFSLPLPSCLLNSSTQKS